MYLNTIIKTGSLLCFILNINLYSYQAQNTPAQDPRFIQSIQDKLKDPEYRTKILPNNFNHLSNLIATGMHANQPPAYLQSVMKLFSNMLKGAEYVNAQAFEDFLTTLPSIAQPYFHLNQSRSFITQGALYDAHLFERINASVNNILYQSFSTQYESFRKDPTTFLSSIGGTIVSVVQEEISHEQARQAIVKFTETALNKLVWDVTNPEQSWRTVKNTANKLAELLEYNILDDTNDLDDFYWSLVTRYCYIINLTASEMPASFYKYVKDDIATHDIILFELNEQDNFMEKKSSYVQRMLMMAEAQSRFHNFR
jgi:hypothetical protein